MEQSLHDLPLGFSMALAQNPEAFRQFGELTEAQQNELIRKAHAVHSKTEMQVLISGILS